MPIYDGRELQSVVIDNTAGFDPTVLPEYGEELTANTIALVGYSVNRYDPAGGSNGDGDKGKMKSAGTNIRLNFNILYVVVLANEDAMYS